MKPPIFPTATLSLLLIAAATPAHAQTITTEYGIEFCTVGAVGNAPVPAPPPWSDDSNSPAIGRGSVNYEYRIGRTEITTAQYLEFANIAYAMPLPERHPNLGREPDSWGARYNIFTPGTGLNFVLRSEPGSALRPVFGVSWYAAALYCNWLHNGKSSDPNSLYTGAYDTSTWGYDDDANLTDAPTHLPGARFWIPTYDEQVKAFHYDPNRFGIGQGGYWLNKNMRDMAGQPGAPGTGQTSAGYTSPTARNIPLMSYPDQMSPWGLLDTSGGTSEWNEWLAPNSATARERGVFGAWAGQSTTSDSIFGIASGPPSFGDRDYGFRLATSIPSPVSISTLGIAASCGALGRARRTTK